MTSVKDKVVNGSNNTDKIDLEKNEIIKTFEKERWVDVVPIDENTVIANGKTMYRGDDEKLRMFIYRIKRRISQCDYQRKLRKSKNSDARIYKKYNFDATATASEKRKAYLQTFMEKLNS